MLAATAINAFGGDFRPFPGPEPVAMLQESNPRAATIGPDTPQCVVYRTREALFFRRDGCYRHLLSEREFAYVMTHVTAVIRAAPIKPFIDLAPGINHEPFADFFLQGDQAQIATRVCGISESGHPSVRRRALAPGASPDELPPQLADLYRVLHSLDYPDSQRWLSKYVEVIAWPYENAPDRSIYWPKDWPSITSDRAVKHGNTYSVYLDGFLLPQIDRFLRRRREMGAIVISGKKWVADYRLVFPSEHVWRNALKRRLGQYFGRRH